MCLYRRWGTGWWNSCSSSTRSHLSSRLSQCPRSLQTESRSVLRTGLVRRGRKSWWKCRQSLLSSSRPLTFQFLVVGSDSDIFKVFAQDRFQERHHHFLALRMRRLKGVFALFHGENSARVAGQAHQMARAGVATHSSSATTEVACDVEYCQCQDVWWTASVTRRISVSAGGLLTTMLGPGTAPYGDPRGRFRESVPGEVELAVAIVGAPVIVQLMLLHSLLFMLLVVPQIQFNFRLPDCPVVRTHLTRAGYGWGRSCDKFQQFTFDGWGSSGARILKSICPALRYRGVEKCAESMLQRYCCEIWTLFHEPLHLAVICSPSGRFRRGVFWSLDDSQL